MSAPDRAAFTLAQGVVQQILTLATGITTLTLTFFNQFAKHASGAAKTFLVLSSLETLLFTAGWICGLR